MKKNIIGYSASCDFNDTQMYPRASAAVPKCPACGYRTEFFPHNPDYVFKKRFKPIYAEDKIDVSPKTTDWTCTYDGQMIVTQRFKDFCERQEYTGLRFLDFNNDKGHFHFMATHEIEADLGRCNVRYDKYCPVCGLYEWVGPPPEYYKIAEPLTDGIYRSDMIIAGPHLRTPKYIVAPDTAEKIKQARYKGFSFRPVYGIG